MKNLTISSLPYIGSTVFIRSVCSTSIHGADQAKKEYYLAKEMADQAIAEMQHRQHVLEMQSSVLAECGITLKDNLAVLISISCSNFASRFE